MFEVFKNPENFLGGPTSNVNKTRKMHFVVVGAGIAGLTNARMLLAVGHNVCILNLIDKPMPEQSPIYNQLHQES